MRTAFLVTLFALVAQVVYAVPPACLLHAVNTQDEPSDLSAVCGDGALTVQEHLAENCGDFEEDAQQLFIDTCSSAGTSVAAYTATSTESSSSTGSSSTTSTGTGMITSTARASGSGSATGTTVGSVQSTAGANADYRKSASLGPMAAAAVALVGAVAAL